MFGLFTYYLTSPINLIILLFSKVNLPQAFMIIILILASIVSAVVSYMQGENDYFDSIIIIAIVTILKLE